MLERLFLSIFILIPFYTTYPNFNSSAEESPNGASLFLAPDGKHTNLANGTPSVNSDHSFTIRKSNDPGMIRGRGKIEWRNWGPAAFDEALRTKKPILLFVVANWSHAGKTMDRITFTDLVVSTRVNEEFIPIRLNRDERPDIDIRMQQSLQALSAGRGWPAILFLSPDGHIWHGGTSLLPDDDVVNNKSGMRSSIQYVLHGWRTDPGAVAEFSDVVENAAKKQAESLAGDEPPVGILNRTATRLQQSLDAQNGGMATDRLMLATENGTVRETPMFPAPRALELCLIHYKNSGDVKSLAVVTSTLDAMLRGGIHDQLAGGFHRYSRDRRWRVPSFEKLLSLNAEMIPVLLHAFAATKDNRYKAAATETLKFWADAQDDAESIGGVKYFPGSQAADYSDSDDGDYFTWSLAEFEQVLRDDLDCRVATLYFGVRESGDLRRTAPERNVLFEAMPVNEVARKCGLSEPDTAQRLERARKALLAARNRRPAPVFDRRAYVDGNALMAAAFIECGMVLGEREYSDRGLRVLRALLNTAIAPDPLQPGRNAAVHALASGNENAISAGLAQDEAALAYACSYACDATHDASFITEAENCLRRMYQNHWDKEEGGYFDRSAGTRKEPAGNANWRVKIWGETWEPSSNELVALTCIRLGNSTGRPEFFERGRSIVKAFSLAIEKAGQYASGLIVAADALQTQKAPK